MEFKNKLEAIISTLDCSNVAIAKAASLDASLISRFRTGARVPSVGSDQLWKLSCGFVGIAKKQYTLNELLELCGVDDAEGEDEVKLVLKYLEDADSNLKSRRKKRTDLGGNVLPYKRKAQLRGFGERLSVLMNAFEISNIRLARSIGVDASVISRLRTGVRTPSQNSRLITDISRFFSDRAIALNSVEQLCRLIGISTESEQPGEAGKLREVLTSWLSERQSSGEEGALDDFLDKLDKSRNVVVPPSDAEVNVTDGEQVEIESYTGANGARQSILKLLSAAAEKATPGVVYIYTEMDTSALTADDRFAEQFAALLVRVLNAKHRVVIVHYVEKELKKLIEVIESWMPLYSCGAIESYVYRKPREERLCATLCVVQGTLVLRGFSLGSAAEQSQFFLSANDVDIRIAETQAREISSNAQPLTQVYTQKNCEQYIVRLGDIERQQGGVYMLKSAPSLLTMPRELLYGMLERVGLSPRTQKRIRLYYESRVKRFASTLETEEITEYCALTSEEALYSGSAMVDIPGFISETPIYYTPDEYARHIANIMELESKHQNYMFRPLPLNPYKNLDIMYKCGVGASLTRQGEGVSAMLFTNSTLLASFSRMFDQLGNNYYMDKLQVRNILNRYNY